MDFPLNQLHNRRQIFSFVSEIQVVLINYQQFSQLIPVYPFLIFLVKL